MRVLLVHGRYRSVAPSGENAVVEREAAALEAAGHRVDLFVQDSDEIAEWSWPRKVVLPVTSIRNRGVRRSLAGRVERQRPDVVHVHNTFPLLSPSVLFACRDARVPVVATLHNYKLLCASGDFFRDGRICHDCAGGTVSASLRHGCYRGSRTATAPVAAGIVANRRAWRTLVSAYAFISASQRSLMSGLRLPADRVFVKHNFVPDAGGPAPVQDRAHRVLFLGRLDAAKGLPLLMRSWEVFRERQPSSSLRLAVAGGGPLEAEVRHWARRTGSVDVLGHLAAPEARQVLRTAVATVVPSEWEETFGLVAVEAMAAGVAVVAPARGSFPEIVSDGEDGRLFDPTPVGLADVLAEVDVGVQRFLGLGAAARSTWARRFTEEAGVQRLVEIYRFAVNSPVPVG